MWIARDKNERLFLYYKKPKRRKNGWHIKGEPYLQLEKDMFLNLKWEDEPVEVSIVPTMMNSVQTKLAESVDEYFDYVSHAQDIHPYSKEKEQELYYNVCWRWQDWTDVKYDKPDTWDLNFKDYDI